MLRESVFEFIFLSMSLTLPFAINNVTLLNTKCIVGNINGGERHFCNLMSVTIIHHWRTVYTSTNQKSQIPSFIDSLETG